MGQLSNSNSLRQQTKARKSPFGAFGALPEQMLLVPPVTGPSGKAALTGPHGALRGTTERNPLLFLCRTRTESTVKQRTSHPFFAVQLG